MLKRFVGSIDNIYQRDFPKVVVLKDPTKGAMSTYFHRAAYSYSSTRKAKTWFLSKVFVVLLTGNLLVILLQSSFC